MNNESGERGAPLGGGGSVKRRGLFRLGALATAATGAFAMSGLDMSPAQAAGRPSTDLSVSDLSATYAKLPGAARNALTGFFYPEGFGTVNYGVGVTSAQAQANAAAVQAAINAANNGGGIAANTTGGGTVVIRDTIEVYTSGAASALVLYGGVHLRGLGLGGDVFSGTNANLPFRGSALRLWAGANQDLIQSANFAALSGVSTPSAYSTPNRFGVYDMVLDGNKAGNSSGDVLKIYGRSYWLQNLVLQNGAGRNLYTEFGSSAGYDNEAHFTNLRITDAAGDGWLFKGPHDSQVSNVFCARNGGSGFITSGNVGSLSVVNMHNWGNGLYNFDLGTEDVSFLNSVCDGTGAGGVGMRVTAKSVRWIGGSIYGQNIQGETLVQLGDTGSSYNITGLDFHTRWFNMAAGSVPLGYCSNVTLGYNVFRGSINNGTNSRQLAGGYKAKVSGVQTLPLTTLNVVSTAGFPSSGSLYTAGGTISYTGTTGTSFTGVSGGSVVTLADGSFVTQSATISTGGDTYEFRSADGNGNTFMQVGGLSTMKIIENVQRDQIGPTNIRSVMSTSQTLASNGEVTIDVSKGNAHNITLQANAASTTVNNPTNSQELILTFIQDATGGRTYAYPANCRFAGGAAPNDATANKRTTVRFRYESATSSWWEISRAVAVG
ncbi:hypothetical protein [Arthrobacter sp. FW306-2-2C-D06B]|uniref:hypothetical protein n=1 Tax=Arthrobacter sp. FW306-2-2C-D06B TaxID=2879618 RepID=UPI001F17369D|nr:hypothetical protein [Arthrobacter sp. FW306-2-2C-D06B]UKA59143.1 hypothetical protein LFT47_01960 [Arthrobacter sp. FW306-2-2C-D06B]